MISQLLITIESMKWRGIAKKQKKNTKYYAKFLNISFLVLSVFSLAIFWLYENVTRIIFSPNKLDIFKQDLHDIALYFQYYDSDIRDFFLMADNIVKAYDKWENIFVTKEKEINDSLEFIKENKEYLIDLWFENYESLLSMAIDLIDNKEEIFELLWKNGEKNYMILLQNTAEKRPNWWFFGSFAFVSVEHWFVKDIEIIDSYYPQRVSSDIRVPVSRRATDIMWADTLWFLSSNKFWFTTTDGHNIKTIFDNTFNNPAAYEKRKTTIDPDLFRKTFNKSTEWVIFIRSDMLTYLLPELQEKLWERQFVNANIDLIRWANLPDKKAIYKKELNSFLDQNKSSLAKKFIKNFNIILSQNYINIHLENASEKFKDILKKNKLLTNYKPTKIYAWDNNISYNKVDTFVKKKIEIYDDNSLLAAESDQDIVDIESLWPGTYTMKISYHLNVPDSYIQFILSLQEEYWVTMWSRERWILAIEPTVHYRTFEEKWRATKSHVYLPPNSSVEKISWDISNVKRFNPPFAKWVYYESTIINKNNKTNTIYIKFTKS